MVAVKSLIKDNLLGWNGSYELFQNEDFLRISASYDNLEIIKIGRVLGIFARWPVLGITAGFIGNPEIRDPELDFLQYIKNTGAASIKIHSNIEISALDGFKISRHDQLYDLIIDVSRPETEILRSIKRQRRRSLKKAVSQNLHFRISTSHEDLLYFYGLCDVMSHHGAVFEILSPQFMQALIDSGFGVLGLATFDDQIVGGVFCLCSEQNLHGRLLCWNRQYKKLLVGDFIYFNVIKWAHENGYKYLNLGHQSLTEWPSITHYKLSFNPILVPAYDNEVILRPNKYKLINLSRQITGKLRKPG